MGTRRRVFKNGVLISDGDTRSLSEEKAKLIEMLDNHLGMCLADTDWEIARAADPTSGVAISNKTIDYRENARNLHNSIELQVINAQTLDDLEYIDVNIKELMDG
jgi:hypothetical protein